MDPLLIAIGLILIGIALLVVEAMLPTFGIIGGIGVAALVASIVYGFIAGPWYGIGLLMIMILSSPFLFVWMMEIWPRTYIGRLLVLNATVPDPVKEAKIPLNKEGITVTELRPIGECDFGSVRCEVISDHGLIAVGRRVEVIAHDADGRPVVRAL